MISRLLIALVTVVLSINNTFSQSNIKSLPEFRVPDYVVNKGSKKELNLDKWVEQVAEDINKTRPGAFTSNFSQDKIVILSAYETIKKEKTKLGYTEKQALESLFNAWLNLSIKEYDQTNKEADFSEEQLVTKALSMSVVKISSMPPGAVVIDGDYRLGSTNNEFLFEFGTHHIEIVKEGYNTVSKKIEVRQSNPINITEQLKRQIKR